MHYKDLILSVDYKIKRLDSLSKTLEHLKNNCDNLEQKITEDEKDLKIVQESAIYYKKSQDILYEKSIGALRELLNSALSFVFYDKQYEIVINLEDKRGTKNLSFSLKDLQNDIEVSLKNGCGNGVRSVVSAILNLFVLLSKDSKIIILDEKYSYISADYLENFFTFLHKICIEKEIRIILITHDPRFVNYADKIYNVTDGRVSLLSD